MGINANGEVGQVLDQAGVEDVLGNRGEDATTEGLAENNEGDADGRVLAGEDSLRGNVGLLQTHAHSDTEDDLKTDPVVGARVDFPGRDETGTNGHDAGGHDHEGSVVANLLDKTTGDDDEENHGYDHRNDLDTRADSAVALDGLKPDRNVECHDDHNGATEQSVPHSTSDRAVEDNAHGDSDSVLRADELQNPECCHCESKYDQQGDDAAVRPGVGGATPLQGEEQADDAGEEKSCSKRVELQDLLLEGLASGSNWHVLLQDQKDNQNCDGTDGEVDVEAPAPADVVCECATDQRANNTGDAKNSSDQSHG